VEWILKKGVRAIFEHDQMLCRAFMEGVDGVEGLRYLGPQGIRNRVGVFSVLVEGIAPLALANQLEAEYGVLTRAGLHCAPLAHSHVGTIGSGGTTRFSFGPFLNVPEIQYAANALAKIASDIRVPARV
jgi:selenocysteine lyase/cysteine desulfurase